jgi:hypothetical protein
LFAPVDWRRLEACANVDGQMRILRVLVIFHACLEMSYSEGAFVITSIMLLTQLTHHRLYRLAEKIAFAMPSESSRERFDASAEVFRASQMRLLSHRQSNTLPSLEIYLELRRNLSGIAMVFDLIEMAESLQIAADDQRWDTLKRSAADIIAFSMVWISLLNAACFEHAAHQDVFAYNNDQFIDNQFNIVSIIQADKGVVLQGAINYAFTLIEQSFRNFLAAESALSLQQPTSPSTWTWNPLSRKQPSSAAPEHVPLTLDSKLYLQGLKDCIVGSLNWSYETELYFGSKGNEVRQFGWVFLKVRDGV